MVFSASDLEGVFWGGARQPGPLDETQRPGCDSALVSPPFVRRLPSPSSIQDGRVREGLVFALSFTARAKRECYDDLLLAELWTIPLMSKGSLGQNGAEHSFCAVFGIPAPDCGPRRGLGEAESPRWSYPLPAAQIVPVVPVVPGDSSGQRCNEMMRSCGVLLWVVSLVFAASEAAAQTVEPFTLADIVRLLREDVPQPRIAMLVADSCVERGHADDVQVVLEAAGAEPALLRVIAAVSCIEEVDPPEEEEPVEEADQDEKTIIEEQEDLENRTTPPGLGTGFGEEEFVLIQPGSFLMGSEDGGDGEQPQHTVTITERFYMQRTPVTQMQWRAVMGTNPSEFMDCGDTCPVEQVSWNDAQEFIQRLNERYPGRNYRLPTEAEWEYAARAGTTGASGGTELWTRWRGTEVTLVGRHIRWR